MQNRLIAARTRLRKQKATRRPILAAKNSDLIDINTLGALARRTAWRFAAIGELELFEIDGRTYAPRAELADWGAIDSGCAVARSGEFYFD